MGVMEAATAPQFVRHTDVYGGHGFIFRAADGRVMVEHCCDGRWGCCPLPVAGELDSRPVRLAAMKHLRRKAHQGVEAQQLDGIAHAGGGNGVKGPR